MTTSPQSLGDASVFFAAGLADADPELARAVSDELSRQQRQVELIASENIVSRAVLEALGPTGHFVNIARGSVVDQPAMVELLRSGALGGAGLDVFNDEPNVPQALIDIPRVVLQPHHASGTHDTRTAMGRLTLDNVAAYFAGRPLLTQV